MAIKIQFRRDTSTNWSSNNPVLKEAELGFDTTKQQFKVGDGSTAWNSLGWLKAETEDLQDVVGGMITTNSESGINVTYDDANGKLDFDVNDPTLSISGDATGSATMTNLGNTDISITHADSGVTSGSYGSASDVPILTIDSKGRITSASTTSVAGVTDFDYNTSTGVLDIDTADGGNFATTVTLNPFDTDDLNEGSVNIYYTDTRAQAAISTDSTLSYSSGQVSMPNSGVTSGSYGSASQVPVITVDDQGRITTASTTAVAGVSSVSYNSTSGDLTIATSDGSSHTVDLGVGSGDSPEFTDATIGGNTVATESYVNTAVANVIDSAPGALDTLNELAAAINDDASFATTVTTSIATKADHATTLTAGTGLNGGGDLSADRTFNLADTAVTAGTYGDASNVGTFTVDNQGRITSASNVTLNTDNVTEGSTNLFYTDARAQSAISASGDLSYSGGVVSFTERTDAEVRGLVSASGDLNYNSATGVFELSFSNHSTSDLSEGSNLYYTDTRAQAAMSGGTGIDYSSGTIALATSGVTADSYGSASEVPVITVDTYGRITSASTTTVAGVTDFDYNTSTGVLDIDTADGSNFATTVTLDPFNSDDLTEGSTNQYFTEARARSSISASGSLSYNSSTGLISFTQGNTDTVSEGSSNLYYTDARARNAISSTGSISYNSTTGVISYTERTDEELQDLVGAMVSTNTESGISVTYDDTNGKLNFNVDDPTITLSGDVTGSATMSNLGNVSITTTIGDDSHNHIISNVDGLQSALDGKVDDSQVLTNVPSGAVFTDTVYTHPSAHSISEITGLQSALDGKTTESYVDTEIANLIGGAPGALDTLNELAAAINDDASYASTITTNLGTKVDKVTGKGLSANDFTNTLKTKLDGIESSADVTDTTNVVAALTAGTNISIATNGTISSTDTTYSVGDSGLTQRNFTTTLKNKLDALNSSNYVAKNSFDLKFGDHDQSTRGNSGDSRAMVKDTGKLIINYNSDFGETDIKGTAVKANGNTIWHTGNDGAGSGLDADKLDGVQASQFIQYFESATAPSVTTNGTQWYDSSDDVLYQRQDGAWVQISTVAAPAVLVYDVNGTIVN